MYSGHFGGATLLCCNPGRLGEAGHVLVHLERRVIRVSRVVFVKALCADVDKVAAQSGR